MTIEEFQKKYGIIGQSKAIKDLVDITMQVAQSDISILIYGESGTGKEIFANAIHGYSKRADKKLVSVNCGAIPEGILESELFGHKKGAFTGAVGNRKGYFEIADGGTLFLDEIAEMPPITQVKLLRVLETKEFMPIGSETVTKVDVRIIAATNKDLQKEVNSKRFRQDLFFRLKAITLNIPPLRSRPADIPLMVYHFLEEYSDANHIPMPTITNDALEFLIVYSWPGNVRELKNTIESAVALCRNGILTKESFTNLISLPQEEIKNLPVRLNKTPKSFDSELILGALIEIKKDLIELKKIAYRYDENLNNISADRQSNTIKPIKELEREAIINVLNYCKWNKKRAAKLLEISERTLFRKIKEYAL